MFKEYVGARYVPKLIGEWNKDLPYEPLSVVTYMGASYTSKVPVPAGIEIGNTTYWACTGNYNAQVTEYRDDTLRLSEQYTNLNNSLQSTQEDVTSLESRIRNEEQFSIKSGHGITILIGDSYLEGWTPEGTVKNWGQFYADISGDTINESLFIFCKGGAGFVNAVDNITFNTLLSNAVNDARIKNDEVSKIIVIGGVNDGTRDPFNYMKTFMDTAKANFVNATVYLGYNGAGAENRCNVYAKMYAMEIYKRYCYLGYVYLDNIISSIQRKSCFSKSDHFHLNEAGQKYFAGAIYTTVHGGHVSFDASNESLLSDKIFVSASHNIITLYFYWLTSVAVNASEGQCTGKDTNAEIEFNSDIIWGRGYLIYALPAIVKYKNYTYRQCDVNLIISDGKIEFKIQLLKEDKSGYEEANNIAEIVISRNTFTMPYYLA